MHLFFYPFYLSLQFNAELLIEFVTAFVLENLVGNINYSALFLGYRKDDQARKAVLSVRPLCGFRTHHSLPLAFLFEAASLVPLTTHLLVL